MRKNVVLFFYRLIDINGDDGDSERPSGEVEDHGLIMVEHDSGDAISSGQTKPMMKETGGLRHHPAELGIRVAAMDVSVVIVIGEKWAIGLGGMMDAGGEEFGKARPWRRPR